MNFINNLINSLIAIPEVIFWIVVILVPVVVIHELGHFLTAKLFGVKIPEFGIGLPFSKPWLSKIYKGTKYTFYPWLLGGFNRIYGEGDAIDHAGEKVFNGEKEREEAKQEYLKARLQEILETRDLDHFIAEQNLPYTDNWKKLASMSYKEISETADKDKEIGSSLNQLSTLIDWEFEAKFDPKRPKLKDTFFAKNWLQKIIILSGGIIFNIASAFIFFSILFGFFNSQIIINANDLEPNSNPFSVSLIYNQKIEELKAREDINDVLVQNDNKLFVLGVAEESVAARAGLESQDLLIKLGQDDLSVLANRDEWLSIINSYADLETELVYFDTSENVEKTETIKLETNQEEGRPILGVTAGYLVKVNYANPFVAAAISVNKNITNTFKAIGSALAALNPQAEDRSALSAVGGPILIGRLAPDMLQLSGPISGLLYLYATISIALGVANALPLPALDGGRIILVLLNTFTGKRNRKLESRVIGITFFILLALGVLVAIKDIDFGSWFR